MLRTIQIVLWLMVLVVGGWLAWHQWSPPLFSPTLSPRGIQVVQARSAPMLSGVDYATSPLHVVNFFASWCLPCQVEHPLLVKLNADFSVIGVAWKDQPEDTRLFLEQFPNGFDQVFDDSQGNIGLEWRLKGVPATYVVDAKGNIVYQRQGVLLDEHYQDIMALR